MRYVHAEKKGGPKECRIQAAPFLETLDDYDVGFYLELLERAIEEVMLRDLLIDCPLSFSSAIIARRVIPRFSLSTAFDFDVQRRNLR